MHFPAIAWNPVLIRLNIHDDCDPLWDTDGSWHTLKLVGATKSKGRGLDNHKDLRNNQEHGLG